MNKLTQEQQENIKQLSDERTEMFLDMNKDVLFDIKKVIDKGEEIRTQFNNLNLVNELTKNLVKQQFDTDVDRLRKFFGEYADAIVTTEDERIGHFTYSIGARDGHKVFVDYPYGKEDWQDYSIDSAVMIGGDYYQKYRQYDIEVFKEKYDTENFTDFEVMFNSQCVSDMFEEALEDYIVYHKPKESEEKLTE